MEFWKKIIGTKGTNTQPYSENLGKAATRKILKVSGLGNTPQITRQLHSWLSTPASLTDLAREC